MADDSIINGLFIGIIISAFIWLGVWIFSAFDKKPEQENKQESVQPVRLQTPNQKRLKNYSDNSLVENESLKKQIRMMEIEIKRLESENKTYKNFL